MLQQAGALGQALWCPRRRIRAAPRREPERVEPEQAPHFASELGLRLVAAEEGRATIRLPAHPVGRGARRGAITLLVEAAAMAATRGPEPRGREEPAASELFVSFLRPPPDHPLTAEARVMSKPGARTSCEVEVRDWNGELVAKGFLTCEA